jgi:hypothetical protein
MNIKLTIWGVVPDGTDLSVLQESLQAALNRGDQFAPIIEATGIVERDEDDPEASS